MVIIIFMSKKIFIALAALFFLLTIFLTNLTFSVNATSLTSLSDTLTRLQKGELSSHTIRFSLPDSESFDTGETIQYDFGEDDERWSVNKATSLISDFDFSDGIERNIVSTNEDCTGYLGSDDIVILIDGITGVINAYACQNFVSSTPGATITLKFGSAAGGMDRVRNPSEPGSTIMKITHTNTAGKPNSGQLAVPIMEFDRVGVSPQKDNSSPDILGSQTKQTTKNKPIEVSLITSHNEDSTYTPNDSNLIIENCFSSNFTSTLPNF